MNDNDEKKNAKQFAGKFYAKHMQPGLARYENETLLVDIEAMKKMMPTGVGKPVYVLHQDVNLDTLKEDAHGFISGSFYNDLDGWFWFEFLAIDDIAHQAISNGWKVSNAYVPTGWGEKGTWHNCDYDREVLTGEYTHLAIVPDPRYEGACILSQDDFKMYQAAQREHLNELQNSKSPNSEGKKLMKFWKNKKEEATAADPDAFMEIKNDKGETVQVTVQQMIDAVTNANKNSDDDKKEEKENQKVMVNGEEMPLSELMNKYCDMVNKLNSDEKKNAEDDEDKDKDEKKNAEADDKKDDEKEEKKNSKDHFEELRNANKAALAVMNIETSMDKVSRGKSRYGS